MKKRIVILAAVVLVAFLAGCSNDSKTNNTVEPLTLEQAQQLFLEAVEVDNSFHVNKGTTEQAYANYSSHFTKNYVDTIILGSGNFIEVDGKWQYAYEGGELIEGTFMNSLFTKPSELISTDNPRQYVLVNHIGDGLYAPHTEKITFIYTEDGWKIDNLIWE